MKNSLRDLFSRERLNAPIMVRLGHPTGRGQLHRYDGRVRGSILTLSPSLRY
jgi:hypothetical protein